MLLEVLDSFRDKNGNPPVFTTFNIVANPDFEKIRSDRFEQYTFEPITRTLSVYPGRDRVVQLFKEARERKLVHMEFHGREHLNVSRWMCDLQKGISATLLAFDHQVTGIDNKVSPDIRRTYQAAFDMDSVDESKSHEKILRKGLMLFRDTYGYEAKAFVPPNYIFNNGLDKILHEEGVKYITTGRIAREPLGGEKYRTSFRYLGKKNKFDQRYMTRNALFETNSPASNDWVNRCLADIHHAFKWRNPAVVSTHRINYIGSIDRQNRSDGLRLLSALLRKILQLWPDAEFINSLELGNLISRKYHRAS